jgi:branched-chain amino acid transport system ATP-binding protein
MREEILRVEELDCFYGAIHALKCISLSVYPGEILCIIGTNGAGKTSVLRSISGINKRIKGSILFGGRRVSGLPPHEIVKAGIIHVPERRRIFSRLTVEENLLMGAYLQTNQETVRGAMDRVFALFPRIRERVNQKGGTLSGGEQQMLAIGRGLMAGPRLLLLDEPSLGLGPLIVRQLFEALQQIKNRGIPLLLVEQNAHMALKVSDRGYLLETGRMVLTGASEDLKHNNKVKEAYLGRSSD